MSIAVVLTPAHKRRLARHAREAGCEPQDLLDDVFKFGFDFVEQYKETATAKNPHSSTLNSCNLVSQSHVACLGLTRALGGYTPDYGGCIR
ncbi:MAG: hypothetical protein EXR27_19875 [Betaproteobacteria bacterium]|nr:hypothetical protein [Betaproteobacteria bacterium]